MNVPMDDKIFKSRSFTLKGRMFYPALLEPKLNTKKPEKPPTYSMLFAFPTNDPTQMARIQEINAWLEQGRQALLPTIPVQSVGMPIKVWGKYLKKDGTPHQAFLKDMSWINLSANKDFKPNVIDQASQEVLNPAELYSGRNVAVSFKFWKYANENFGFSANLNAVIILDGGEYESGGGVDVNEAFKDFLGDTTAPAGFADPYAQQVMPPVGQPQPMVAPIAQPMAAPIAQPMAAPIAQPMAAPIAQPMAAPIAQPMAAPIAQPMAAPIAQPPIQQYDQFGNPVFPAQPTNSLM